jgi:hypothetical protein
VRHPAGQVVPGPRLGLTNPTNVSNTEGWQTVALQSPASVSAGQTIWLAWLFEKRPALRYTNGSPGRASSTATWSGGMPDTFGPSTVAAYIYSIYASYSIAPDTQPPANADVSSLSATVDEANTAPVLAAIGSESVHEGQLLTFTDSSQPDVAPVYRFWLGTPNRHFFTINPIEKNKPLGGWFDMWTYEQIAWYAYGPETP